MSTRSQGPRVEALDRALVLLEALADSGPEGASLGDLAGATKLNKSTAYRALATMRLRGFAGQDGETGNYRLGPAGYSLGDRSDAPRNLARALHPALVALSRAADELVHLGVLADDYVMYLDKVEPARAIRVWSTVGQRVPVASTSMGRALLAARGVPDNQLSSYLSNLSPDSEVTEQRLRTAVRRARDRGYAVELGENERDVACIGTAVMRGTSAVAAISITALAVRMTEPRQHQLARLISSEVGPLLPQGLTIPPLRNTAA